VHRVNRPSHGQYLEVIFSLNNPSDTRYHSALVSCVGYDASGEPIGEDEAGVFDVAPRSKTVGKALAKWGQIPPSTKCRVGQANPY
jgi:hypothetical protein